MLVLSHSALGLKVSPGLDMPILKFITKPTIPWASPWCSPLPSLEIRFYVQAWDERMLFVLEPSPSIRKLLIFRMVAEHESVKIELL